KPPKPQGFGEPFSTGDVTLPPVPPRVAERPFFLSAPVPADVLDDEPTTQEMPAIGDVLVHRSPEQPPGEQPVKGPAPLFTPRSRAAAEPVYRMPAEPVQEPGPAPVLEPGPEAVQEPVDFGTALVRELERDLALDPVRAARRPRPTDGKNAVRKTGARPSGKKKKKRRRERHHDWAWELIGFLICVAIAMIVFFSVPMFMGP
ncbi:MAG: hypothetical protein HOY71_51405, partial [Nonomuraea sp.]|nr:hypothetical protein [Nonomuraea sp.]